MKSFIMLSARLFAVFFFPPTSIFTIIKSPSIFLLYLLSHKNMYLHTIKKTGKIPGLFSRLNPIIRIQLPTTSRRS